MSSSKINPKGIICFTVHKANPLPDFIGKDMWVVQFSRKNLEDPNSEPIGLHFYNGNRQYLWRDKVWIEYTIFWKGVRAKIQEVQQTCKNTRLYNQYQEVLDDLSACSMSSIYPIPGETQDPNTHFMRLLRLSQ